MISALRVLAFLPEGAMAAALRIAVGQPHDLEVRDFATDGDASIAGELADVLIVGWSADRSGDINRLATTWRVHHTGPVLALCSGGTEQFVAALLAGADQILTPPFYGVEIQARVMAHLRLSHAIRQLPVPRPAQGGQGNPAVLSTSNGERATGRNGDLADEQMDSDGEPAQPLSIDRRARRVFVTGAEIELTQKEYELLDFLLQHSGEALSRDALLDAVWGLNFDTGTNMVDVYVHFLRKKLRAAGLRGVVETVRGHGYRLNLKKGSPA